VDPEELRVEGIFLNRETLERQKRHYPEFTDPKRWARFVRSLRDSPGCYTMGAYIDGRLAAYLVYCRDGAWLRLLYKMSRTADLIHFTNYALDYQVIEDAAKDPSIRAIENGFSSLNGDWGVDAYKKNLGYTTLPTHLSIHLHPAIAPWAASRPVVAAVRKAGVGLPAPRAPAGGKGTGSRGGDEDRENSGEREAGAGGLPAGRKPGICPLWRPYLVVLAWQLWNTIRRQGIGQALHRAARFISTRLQRKKDAGAPPRVSVVEEVLGLQPGEWVEVKSEAEIQATLDARKKCRGLLFTDEMRPCFGRRYRVLKRVDRIYLEESKHSRRLKNTVILEAANCLGTDFQCDRYCYLFWREAWLRRVNAGPSEPGTPFPSTIARQEDVS